MPIKDMLDNLKQKAADKFENVAKGLRGASKAATPVVQNAVSQASAGVRGAANTVGQAAQAAWTSPLGTAARNLGDAAATRAGAAVADVASAAEQKMSTAAESLREDSKRSVRSPNAGKNPNVKAGGSPEAKAFRTGGGGAGTPPTAPTTAAAPKPGFFAKAGRAVGLGVRGLGVAQAGKGVYDATQGNYGDAVDNVTMGAATAINPVLGTLGNIATGLRDRAIQFGVDKLNPSYTNFTPEFAAQLRAQEDGRAFAPQAPAQTASAGGTDLGLPGGTVAMPSPAERQPGFIPDPSSAEVPAAGTGSFQRTGPTRGPVRTIRSDTVQPADEAGRGLRAPISAKTPMGVIAEALTRVKAAQARESGVVSEAKLANAAAKTKIDAAKVRADLKKDASASFEKEIDNEVMRGIDPNLSKEEREAMAGQRGAEMKARMRYTLGDSGQEIANMNGAEKNKLFVGAKFHQKLVGSRGEGLQKLRDWAGQKQFDSDNYYSYYPEKVERTATGYRIITKNGNNMDVASAAGGGFVLLGPNLPVDKDMMDEILKVAKRQAKGNK